jgi:hypothetical protein
MSRRNFLRYTFDARAIAWFALITVASALAAWGCYVLLPSPMNRWVAIGAGSKYVIFCSLFFGNNFIKWRRYVTHNNSKSYY